MRRIGLLLAMSLAAISLSAGLAACGGDDGEALTVYSGRGQDLVDPILESYSEQTGQELEIRYADTAELAATIVEEGENSPADVFFAQDAGALGALQKEGLLAELPRSILSQVPARFRSPEGRWVGTSGRARVVAYDSGAVEEAELPASVFELTEPAWEGRVGWAPENGSFQAFVTALRLIEGEQRAQRWLEGMVENGAVPYSSNTEVRDAIEAGEVDAGLINHYYVAQAREESGPDYPVEIHYVDGEDAGALINVAGAGVLESSDQPAEAEALIEFLLGEEAQRYFAEETKEYPLIDGVEADPTLTPLERIESPDIDLSNIDDLETTLEMIQRSGAL